MKQFIKINLLNFSCVIFIIYLFINPTREDLPVHCLKHQVRIENFIKRIFLLDCRKMENKSD
jgi:hypothetical protein